MTLLLITLTLFSLPPDGAALFEESNTAYHEGQYTDAIAGYEKLQHQFEVKNAALFFNLGNAWRKNGNPGKAILYYEMALAM
ncbi:MAG: tetratricopeptide repeat-containing protein, partial [Candidatus Hydrogenedentes bacterium]|nr:tetratricopeptide repeat-containing protein [Candidatus Hydrogenedentota bacterium]